MAEDGPEGAGGPPGEYVGMDAGDVAVSQKFYLIPPIVLSRLFDDFSPLVGEKTSSVLLNRAGYRCGGRMGAGLDLDTGDRAQMESALQELLIQLGLGVLKLEKYTPESILITCGDSNEGRAMGGRPRPSCNFTTGYITGLLESITGSKFRGEEQDCICTGAKRCRYVFTLEE